MFSALPFDKNSGQAKRSVTILILIAMKQYYVYILKCSDNSYYTGFTNNMERRITEHNSGMIKGTYTSTRLPVTLVWLETFLDPNQAIMVEKQIKGWSRRKKEALINEDWEKLVEYSRNYTEFGVSSKD